MDVSEGYSEEESISLTVSAIDRLAAWIEKNGWAGYDPYDLKGTRLYIWALGLPRTHLWNRIFRKLVIGPLFIGEMLFPTFLRKLFRVKPSINAKGISLYAVSLFNLYRIRNDSVYLSKGLACLDWLLENQSPGYPFPCWGYPFNWQSLVFIPARTPASVVSAAACDAFWHAWILTKDQKYLDVCVGVCEFFINGLNLQHLDDETVCFSYTPVDYFHVHNINLLVAELLIRVGHQVDNEMFITLGEKAANYALQDQKEDGSIYYWGRKQTYSTENSRDHYHSGFEMRCLFSIWKLTAKEKYKKALDRYYAFYLKHFIQKESMQVVPKMYPSSVYPINIHTCAEGLLLNSVLAADYSEARENALKMLPWVLATMQMKDGHFMYMRRYFLGKEMRSTIAYWRWGQAWMMLALSQVLLSLSPTAIADSDEVVH